MATWSTSYFMPYFSSQEIDFFLQVEKRDITKPTVALKYIWKLFFINGSEKQFIANSDNNWNILRGTSKNKNIVEGEFRIPVEYISTGEYILEIQLYSGEKEITPLIPMAKFNVINSGELIIQLWIAGVGILGIIIGIILTLLAQSILG